MERTVSLVELYARVPAAEEEDLEQSAAEQYTQWLREYAPLLDIDPPAICTEQVEVEQPQEVSPTLAQSVALVQHLLGATVLGEQ